MLRALTATFILSVLLFSVAYAGEQSPGTETLSPAPGQNAPQSQQDELVDEFANWAGDVLGEWSHDEVMGIALWQYIAVFPLILLGFVLRKVSDYTFQTKLIPLMKKTHYSFDKLLVNAASAPLGMLFLILGFQTALAILPLPSQNPDIRGFVTSLFRVLLAADLVWFLFRLIDVLVEYLSKLASRTESKLDEQLVPLIRRSLKVTVGIVCGVWIIGLFGYNVSSLLAGLGIGGLAVALALQDTLSNFFGSVMIFLDRPFVVGQWIKVDGVVEGIVEQIGFRSTRVRTWPATLVTIPNKTLSNANVDNWSKMPKRRVLQNVGVTYETTADEMEQAVAGIREIIENDEGVDKEFIVVRFTDFGDSSLNITLYYFTIALDFATHNTTKERINLAIMRLLRGMGLSIAFPTRTLYLEGDVARALTGQSKHHRPQEIEHQAQQLPEPPADPEK